MSDMDEVDRQQQNELESLKRIDIRHDKEIIVFKVLGTVIVLAVIAMFTLTMETVSKSQPYNCPHLDCVHHR